MTQYLKLLMLCADLECIRNDPVVFLYWARQLYRVWGYTCEYACWNNLIDNVRDRKPVVGTVS